MSKQQVYDKVDILGVEIDVVSPSDAIDYIMSISEPGRPAAYVVKPYVEFLDRSYREFDIQELLNDADLAVADGIALVWAAAYLYAGPRSPWRFVKTLAQIMIAPRELAWPLTGRAAGTNFTWPLLETAARTGRRIALVGTPRSSNIEQTAAAITRRLPNAKMVLSHTGTDPEAHDGQQSRRWLNQLALAINDSQADIILLGLGFPRQEFAAAYLRGQLKHGVIIGEGGTFDYTSFGGHRAKAPTVMQTTGLEWLWRLMLEPSRLKRHLAIPRFIWRVWLSRR